MKTISEEIWERKYRYDGLGDAPEDTCYEDTWKRIAGAAASKEKDSKFWEDEFYSILKNFRFLPAGRIIANAGTMREEVTMFNCYVMNSIEDSIEGIFDTVKDSALTQKQGGGVGFDFSTIRPKGSMIKGCESNASGPISFMQVLDSTCRTIMSAGQRRGAQMGVMRCDHPDIEEFITAKRNNDQLKMFNLSVGITDGFMQAVKDDADWDLVFKGKVHKTIKASELWDSIMSSTYDYAEPGFILIDKINKMNNLSYCEEICATNPCGEQPLPPFGACLLGSLNLTRFVNHPFTEKANVDFKELAKVTKVAVRLLDNVIDLSNYPLDQQRKEAEAKRRMGIGITGLADLFIFMQLRYGTNESADLAEKIMQTITYSAYEASVELGKEKGVFKKFDAKKYCQGAFIKSLPADLQKKIEENGLRNSHLTSVAPTGTISLFAENVSSGLEPVFAYMYTRKVRNTDENDVTEMRVTDYAFKTYSEFIHKPNLEVSELPEYFVSSSDIAPSEHIKIQASLQKYVDSSISKTINIPADYPFEDFKHVYIEAYEKGLKGCTTFRPSDYITGVLVKDEDKKKEEETVKPKTFVPRPQILEGTTYKIKTPLSTDALYITINDLVKENGTRRPYELFINTKNLQHFSWIVAMTRLISAVFRHDAAPIFLVQELKSIYDPNGGYFVDGGYVPSLAADIGRIIEKHLTKIGIIAETNKKTMSKPAKEAKKGAQQLNNDNFMFCPSCNEKALVSQENCLKCLSCNYSKCG
ncbi:MAG: adenosylcobalamin-dependent ribonucleoside-diphosphate reductase [Kiritimatiellae bacterium]|jgi:ribonucleoside-diphosphate reductase alpha chain|nr:adenosylcobalamin-dependent ribonucleoside-diphosphate reductase [Kiritimatiellia bacterium]